MSEFKSMRVARKFVREIEATPEKIFPLLCPVKEFDWIEVWDCDVVFSESGVMENLCVFTTDDFDGVTGGVWVVSHYDSANFRIEFVVTFPKTHVEKLEIQLTRLDKGRTEIEWTRIGTSLNEAGSAYVKDYYGEQFNERTAMVLGLLEYYCKTGEMKKMDMDSHEYLS